MSTPPPPFQPNQPPNYSPPGSGQPGFGQPDSGQPGFGQPGQAPGPLGAPSWQTGGSPTGLQQQPIPPSKSKTPLIIGAVVVVIILIVAGVFVLGGDDDGGGGKVDAAGANAGLATVLRDGSFEDGVEAIDDCPLGDVDALSALAAGAIDVDDEVIDGEQENTLTEEGDFPGSVFCQVKTDEDVRGVSGLYFEAILDPPRDYEGYVEDLYGENTGLDFEESQEYLGGEVFLFCGEAMGEDGGFTGCDADWVNTDEDIALNVFLYGDGDTDDAFEVLKAVLATMAENLAQQADPDES